MLNALPLGKLSSHLLSQLIKKLPAFDDSIVIPPGIGLDAAGIRTTQSLVSVTADPITFSTHELGTYSLCININDIACTGAKPRWYTATLLLPFGTTQEALINIWDNLTEALEKYKIQAVGGHIEVTESVNTPILAGQMIGEAISDQLLTPKNAKPGDQILLCRPIAIEGTALLSREKIDLLKPHFSSEVLEKSQNLLKEPGICIWPLVERLMPTSGMVALHDPTEGGLANALHEWADVTECGFVIDGDAIPILPETQALCQFFNLDPIGLLASGSLLILCNTDSVAHIKTKLGQETLVNIGYLTENTERNIRQKAVLSPLPRFQADEVIKGLSYPKRSS